MESNDHCGNPCPPPKLWEATRTASASCPAGMEPNVVTAERTFVSCISRQHAEEQALALAFEAAKAELVCRYQGTAQYMGECGIVQSATAFSTVSQDAADAAALVAAKAAADAICADAPFTSTQTVEVTANCPEGYVGEPATAEATATASSAISQEAADDLAYSLAYAQALDIATNMLGCSERESFTSTQTASYTATCPEGLMGEPSQATVQYTFTSYISQQDADETALSAAQSIAQTQAEAGLVCVPAFYTSTQEVTLTCPEGTFGDPSVGVGYGESTVSQQDADEQALAAAQANAESGLVCTPLFSSTQSYTVQCEGGGESTATETRYGVTQEDADAQALSAAQASAIAGCFPP